MKIIIFIISTLIISINALECFPEGCTEENTLCKYPTTDPAPKCGRADSTTLTQEEKDELLKAHNDRREWVASGQVAGQPAGIIPPLQWDDDLEELARRWALQCEIAHDSCRYLEKFSVGQNWMWRANSGGYHESLTDMVDGFFSEHENYDGSGVGALVWQETPQIGHYTQLVWGATTSVGCAVNKYYDGQWYSTFLVCDYGPQGNVIGQPVYQTT